jgi:hypothetical protein
MKLASMDPAGPAANTLKRRQRAMPANFAIASSVSARFIVVPSIIAPVMGAFRSNAKSPLAKAGRAHRH